MPQRAVAILLMGPTASGKTDLALKLVSRFPCDIVSVDSTQVYRGLDIGSAKPGPDVLAVAPHRLIDILDPTETYSAARFRDDALREMASIHAQGRIPLLVGGTGLYFRALTQGLSLLPAADPEIRSRLEAEAAVTGWAELHRRLARVDPAAAARIHPNDPQRIQRALEVFELAGRPLSELQRRPDAGAWKFPFRSLKLALIPRDRAVLRDRIQRRFMTMLQRGFEREVRDLWARGDLTPDLPALRSVGYRQMLNYLLGASSYTDAVERGIIATRQLAKRQMTWLRAEPDCLVLFDDEAPTERVSLLIRRSLRG